MIYIYLYLLDIYMHVETIKLTIIKDETPQTKVHYQISPFFVTFSLACHVHASPVITSIIN